MEELELLYELPDVVPISAKDRWNLDDLLEMMWAKLGLTRVYTKPRGQIPDYSSPVILRTANPTIEDFCMRVHKAFKDQFAAAWCVLPMRSRARLTRPRAGCGVRPSSTSPSAVASTTSSPTRTLFRL